MKLKSDVTQETIPKYGQESATFKASVTLATSLFIIFYYEKIKCEIPGKESRLGIINILSESVFLIYAMKISNKNWLETKGAKQKIVWMKSEAIHFQDDNSY